MTATVNDTILIVSSDDSAVEVARLAGTQLNRAIKTARTREEVNALLESGTISLIIVDLRLKKEEGKLLLDRIRKQRPQIQYLTLHGASKGSVHDVLAYNLHRVAQGLDGTFSVQDFHKAIAKAAAFKQAEGIRRFLFSALCLFLIFTLVRCSHSAAVVFVGVTWSVIICITFIYSSMFPVRNL